MLGSCVCTLAADPPVKLKAFYTSEAEKNRMIIIIRFLNTNDVLVNFILDPKQGAPYDSRSYELVDQQGNPVSFQPIVDDLEPGYLASNVRLLPASQLDTAQTYKLTIKEGKLVFVLTADGKTNIVQNAETQFTLVGSNFVENVNYFERESSAIRQNSFQLLGGSAGGVGTAKLTLDKSRFVGLDWVNARFEGSADFSLDNADKTKYFDNISGELSLYSPVELFKNDPINRRYSELSIHFKTDSDQDFKTTDGLLGIQYGIYPKDPLTRWLGTLFVRTNTHAGALIVLGYDYAHNLAGGTSTNAIPLGINTDTADHRTTALMRWRVPVLQDFDFSFLPTLGGRYDLDLDLELKGVYDINARRFLDQSRVSLEFTRSNDVRFKPVFVFTWARGKEGPTWKEVNTLLAGMKISF